MIDLPTTLHAPAPLRMPRFDVPAVITAIDLSEDPVTAAERLATRARTVMPGIGDEQVAHLVTAQRGIVDTLRAGGVYWAGSCVARSEADQGRLTVAHLAASIVDVETDRVDPIAVVADLNDGAGTLTGDGPSAGPASRVADVVQLPSGPAIVVIEEQVVRPAVTVIGTPDDTEHRVRQVLVALPVPDAPRLAVLSLATEDLADWPAYLELMATVARSLTFTSV